MIDNLSCLDRFEERMRFVSFFAQLAFQTGPTKRAWKTSGFGTSQQEQFTLLVMVMLFIMERSINEEVCTKDDIAEFIEATDRAIWHRGMTSEQCRGLSQFIVDTLLINDGTLMTFRTYSSATGGLVDIPVQFVRDEYWQPDSRTDKRITYRMTDIGYSCLFATLELEDSTSVPLQRLIVSYLLNQGDFDNALQHVRKINQTLKQQKQKLADDIHAIRQNVSEYRIDRYGDTMDAMFAEIDAANQEFREYKELAASKIAALEQTQREAREAAEAAAAQVTPAGTAPAQSQVTQSQVTPSMARQRAEFAAKTRHQLTSLRDIKESLDQGLLLESEILHLAQDMSGAYSEALDSSLAAGIDATHRYPFPARVYAPLLDDARLLESVASDFLAPLFAHTIRQTPQPDGRMPENRIFNPAVAFLPQVRIEDDDEDEIALPDADEEAEKREKAARAAELDADRTAFLALVREIARTAHPRVTLGELARASQTDAAAAARLAPDPDRFPFALSELLGHDPYNIAQIRETMSRTIRTDDEQFDAPRALVHGIDTMDDLADIEAIEIETLGGDIVFHAAAAAPSNANAAPSNANAPATYPLVRCTDCAIVIRRSTDSTSNTKRSVATLQTSKGL